MSNTSQNHNNDKNKNLSKINDNSIKENLNKEIIIGDVKSNPDDLTLPYPSENGQIWSLALQISMVFVKIII